MVIEGVVARGKRLGRVLGFPTANVRAERVLGEWLPNGVYVAAMWVQPEVRARLGMLNQGVHPTAPEGPPTVEVNLLDFDRDLYGRSVRVEYLCFLRPETRFDDLDALKAQLARDREQVRQWRQAALTANAPDAAQRRARQIDWQDAP